MAPWKNLEEKRAKAVACKERRKQRKVEDRYRNRQWEEATSFFKRLTEAENSDSRSDSWSPEERTRVRNEIWADIRGSSKKLAEQNERVSFAQVVQKVSWDKSTNDSAQSVGFHSETKGNIKLHDKPKDCLNEMNDGVFSYMFDDSNVSVQIGPDSVSHAEPINFSCDTQEEDGHASEFPFCCKGVLFPRVGSQRQIVVIRDHEAMHSLASWDSLNWLDFTDADEEKVMQLVAGKNVRVPLVDIRIECEFVSGTIRCGYGRTMIPGIDLIIGNDVHVVTVEEPLEGSISTAEVRGSVNNGIDAVNVRTGFVCTNIEAKKRDDVYK